MTVANFSSTGTASVTRPGAIAAAMLGCLMLIAASRATGRPGSPPDTAPEAGARKIHAITEFGAIGDGRTDDTAALQRALARCSKTNGICRIPAGKSFLVTAPLYIWGKATLAGEDASSRLLFNVPDAPYLLNVGISGRRKMEAPFTGSIENVTFKVVGGSGGRIIFFWRTRQATIDGNVFEVGNFGYSATSSGNNDAWVQNGFANSVREDVTITNNRVLAASDIRGSEGIGLEWFDGALIEGNEILGVGDDPIGIHYSTRIKILRNKMRSVDGRLYVANSSAVEIAHNDHERVRSERDGAFHPGISLLYIGFESYVHGTAGAPADTWIHHNRLRYPPGAVDKGAAIYLYAPRGLTVEDNTIINDSEQAHASALHLLPAKFSKGWVDPARRDPPGIARVGKARIQRNSSIGRNPLPFKMTGNCEDYRGPVEVRDNVAGAFTFYCPTVTASANRAP